MTLRLSHARPFRAPESGLENRQRSRWRDDRTAVVLLAAGEQDCGDQATACAAELAVALHATLRIVHVVAPVQFRVARLAPMRAVDQRLVDPFDSPVLLRARELAWRHGTAAVLDLVAGDMPRAVIATAWRARADALVLSAPRRDGLLGRASPRRRWMERHAPCQIITPATSGQAAWS